MQRNTRSSYSLAAATRKTSQHARKMAQDWGYAAVNLNCGCPSDRVQSGKFGACLMKEPELVGECIAAMQDAVIIPVTVKCRIAIDEEEELSFLNRFIETISKAGCQEFTIHARKAWLQGLSPKQNREVPPLRYDIARAIKDNYPHLHIGLNGGIHTTDDIKTHLEYFDSVMIGRAAYQNPWLLHDIERDIFSTNHLPSRTEIALSMIPYIEQQAKDFGTPPKSVTRHMTGLFQGLPGAKHWRRYLSENAHKNEMSVAELIENALPRVEKAAA